MSLLHSGAMDALKYGLIIPSVALTSSQLAEYCTVNKYQNKKITLITANINNTKQ